MLSLNNNVTDTFWVSLRRFDIDCLSYDRLFIGILNEMNIWN